MTDDSNAPYTIRQVQALIGLGPAVVRALVAKGFVTPSRGPRRELRFTFQDLLLLKTARSLRLAQVPTRRILDSLAALKAGLPASVPLTGLRITSAGNGVVVHDAGGVREATTGQLLLDFEVQARDATVVVSDRLAVAAAPPGDDGFALGEALEATDPARAEAAYRAALAERPGRLEAIVNLGALLCESGRCQDAVELFERSLADGHANALLHFNLAIALEDLGRDDGAVEAYEAALAADPGLADAHYNLGLLLERRGDGRGALRHFSAWRRLEQG